MGKEKGGQGWGWIDFGLNLVIWFANRKRQDVVDFQLRFSSVLREKACSNHGH